ncbi:MAG: SDR family NAD(P)-dependent oxidoreductase [Leptospiraceae bacterium]|nr:SDR family NAD(P)-dependent oxidoreductase [Leptospiraceae bacterium]
MHILITGAATGIGESIVEYWYSKFPKDTFSILDKDEKQLKITTDRMNSKGMNVKGFPLDLTKLDEFESTLTTVKSGFGEVDVLINNAGVMIIEDFSVMSWEKGMMMLTLDFIAPMKLIKLLLPSMLSRKSGGIINLASMAGKTPLPGSTWYGGAKAGFGLASEVLAGEVKDDGIHVLTVYPGPVSTALEKGARAGYDENAIMKMMPVGDREVMAARIVEGYLKKLIVVSYPDIYDIARIFPPFTDNFVRMFAPKTKK